MSSTHLETETDLTVEMTGTAETETTVTTGGTTTVITTITEEDVQTEMIAVMIVKEEMGTETTETATITVTKADMVILISKETKEEHSNKEVVLQLKELALPESQPHAQEVVLETLEISNPPGLSS